MRGLIEQIRAIWTSGYYAVRGILFAARCQRNFRLHLVAATAVLIAGIALGLRNSEMALLVLTVSLVILGELLNTALEYTLNLLEVHNHPLVQTAKDIAAGGVLLCALGSVVVGILLLGPRLWVFLFK